LAGLNLLAATPLSALSELVQSSAEFDADSHTKRIQQAKKQ
jgi:hypothetical protein